MQKVYINKLLENKNFIRNFMVEPNGQIALDFTNVREIRLNDIQKLMNLQKVAILNGNAVKFENLEPDITKILVQTGIYKTFNVIGNHERVKIPKRLGLAVE
jgi:anti-anti-sigma regulatory factor